MSFEVILTLVSFVFILVCVWFERALENLARKQWRRRVRDRYINEGHEHKMPEDLKSL